MTTRVGRAHGQLVTMVIKRQLSCEVLDQIADELESLSSEIRSVTKEKRHE